MFRWAVFAAPILLVAFAIGLPFGIKGVAWSYLIANVALMYPLWQAAGSLVDMGFGTVMRSLSSQWLAALAFAAALFAANRAADLSSLPVLALTSAAVALGYWCSVVMLDEELRADALSLVTRAPQPV
jgi:PST family polysaccharide transporter